MKNRVIKKTLQKRADSFLGRIIVLTGARQTGKTTLTKRLFTDYQYVSLESPVIRPEFSSLSSNQWHLNFPKAILDEIQKTPQLIESIKAVYDEFDDTAYILLGSSQILLMKQVKESLAGRCTILELFPLTLPEMLSEGWEDSLEDSSLITLLKGGLPNWPAVPLSDGRYARAERVFQRYLKTGGYPVLWKEELSEEDAYQWLRDYVQTYLQRDIRDLAEIRNLEPFTVAQKMTALQTGQLINYSSMARDAGITTPTAQRFIEYLKVSYQVFLLQPWFRNPSKRLCKSPKIHYLDPGICAAVTGRRGMLTGAEYESAVIAEIIKQVKNSGLIAEFYHLRTLDGKEVDLLIELPDFFFAFEIKQSRVVSGADIRHLKGLGEILDKPLAGAFILSNDPHIQHFAPNITAVPASLFLA